MTIDDVKSLIFEVALSYHCSFADADALLLYLYLPIFMTLVANLITLWAGRHIRISRLRRLELGAKHHHHKRHGASGQ